MDLGGVGSDGDAKPVCWGEEKTHPEGEAVHSQSIYVSTLSLRDRVRNADIQKELGVELLLFQKERSQIKWFGHLVRMPPRVIMFSA